MALVTGIIGGWKLEEVNVTTLGSEMNTPLGASTSATRGVVGKVGNAIQLNGSTGFGAITSANYNVLAGEDRTWSFWINQSAADTGTALGKVNATTASHWDIQVSGSPIVITFSCRDSATTKASTWTSSFTADGDYHLVFVTFTRATSGVQVYVPISSTGDMNLATLTSAASTIDTSALGAISNANQTFIGKRGNNTNFLAAKIDEVIIWNRVLSLAEMNEIHNSGAGMDVFDSVHGSPIINYVGTGQTYSAIQDAFDDFKLNHNPLPANCEIVLNAGETFIKHDASNAVLTLSRLSTGTKTLTVRSSDINNKAIVDGQGVDFPINESFQNNIIIQGLKIVNNPAGGSVFIVGMNPILDSCDIDTPNGANSVSVESPNYINFPATIKNCNIYSSTGYGGLGINLSRAQTKCNFYNNTIRKFNIGINAAPATTGQYVIYDNIFVDMQTSSMSFGGTPSGLASDNNLYFTGNAIHFIINATTYTTVAAWQVATGQDSLSIAGLDPLITSLRDPRISDFSPAKKAGVQILGNVRDYFGEDWLVPPSIGCAEFFSSKDGGSDIPSVSIKHILNSARFKGSIVLDTTNETDKERINNISTLRDTILSVMKATSKANVHLNTSAGKKLIAISNLDPLTATAADIINAVRGT